MSLDFSFERRFFSSFLHPNAPATIIEVMAGPLWPEFSNSNPKNVGYFCLLNKQESNSFVKQPSSKLKLIPIPTTKTFIDGFNHVSPTKNEKSLNNFWTKFGNSGHSAATTKYKRLLLSVPPSKELAIVGLTSQLNSYFSLVGLGRKRQAAKCLVSKMVAKGKICQGKVAPAIRQLIHFVLLVCLLQIFGIQFVQVFLKQMLCLTSYRDQDAFGILIDENYLIRCFQSFCVAHTEKVDEDCLNPMQRQFGIYIPMGANNSKSFYNHIMRMNQTLIRHSKRDQLRTAF